MLDRRSEVAQLVVQQVEPHSDRVGMLEEEIGDLRVNSRQEVAEAVRSTLEEAGIVLPTSVALNRCQSRLLQLQRAPCQRSCR